MLHHSVMLSASDFAPPCAVERTERAERRGATRTVDAFFLAHLIHSGAQEVD
jgi:hypothetical protein